MSKQGTVVTVVGAAVGLGVVGYLTWALIDMKKQRDVAVESATNLAKQIQNVGGIVGGIIPSPSAGA